MKTCPYCRQENLPEANFCNHCGKRLKASGSTTDKQGGERLAERRQLTILFCDLVDSTPLSEKLDPEEFRHVITNYHQVAEKVVKHHNGFIAQYLGDGLLVYFGYPEGFEDAPKLGVKAGLGILDAMAHANQQWENEGKSPVKIRIGIHTGLVVVDDHLALGETVNIAARLEGLAPHNGLVISPQTLTLVHGWFDVKSLGDHKLKGISKPMEVYQVLRESGAVTRLDIAKRKGLSPLVGRQDELTLLIKYWDRAKRGEGNLLLVNGEPGIGKSRLVDTLEEQIALEPKSRVMVARCSAYQRNSAFYPMIELFEKALLQFEASDSPAEKLGNLQAFLQRSNMDDKNAVALFAEFLSITAEIFPPLIISPVSKRQKLMDAITQALLAGTSNSPLLLVLEDLHWADASTLEWLKLFQGQLPSHSLFMICTTRPGSAVGWKTDSGIVELVLRRLSEENMADICHHQTQGKKLPMEILKQITMKTDGVPLFVEELTKMIVESDLLVEKSDSFEMAGAVSTMRIPSTLQDSLLARLDRLSSVKELVQVGAVLGREFSLDMLGAIVPEKEDLEHSLSQLLDAEILYRRDHGKQSIYQFKHALIQDAAYESMLKSRRQQLHLQVADVMEQKFKEVTQIQPELLAHHYTEAGRPLLAIPIWLQAGQQASQKNATAEAIAHLEKGIGLLPHLKTDSERNNLELDFRLTLGGTYVVSHGFPHPIVKETFNRARDIAQTIEVSPKLALVLFNLLSYYFNTEDYQAQQELVDYMTKLAKDPEHGYWFDIFSHQIDATGAVLRGEFSRSKLIFEYILRRFDPSFPFPWALAPSGYLEIGTKSWLMVCLQIMGHMDEAKDLCDRHLSYAKEHKDSMTLYHIYTFPALYKLEAREWSECEKILEEYLPIVRAFGDPVFNLTAEVYYNIAKAFQGDRVAFDTAVHLINVCFDVGFKAFAVSMAPFIGEQYFRIGEYKSAIGWIDKIFDHVNKTGSHINSAEFLRIKGLSLQALGEPDSIVEEKLIGALELAQAQSANTFELRAARDLSLLRKKQGKTKEALVLLKSAYDRFDAESDSVDLQEVREIMKEFNGPSRK